MSIDKSKIKVGDKVKIRLDVFGLITISEDWVEVKSKVYDKYGRFDLIVGDLFLESGKVQVIEHKPGFADLERDVENARNALVAAEAALAIAKKDSTFRFKVGDRVRLANGHITTIEACGDIAYPHAYRVMGGLHYDQSQIDRWNP